MIQIPNTYWLFGITCLLISIAFIFRCSDPFINIVIIEHKHENETKTELLYELIDAMHQHENEICENMRWYKKYLGNEEKYMLEIIEKAIHILNQNETPIINKAFENYDIPKLFEECVEIRDSKSIQNKIKKINTIKNKMNMNNNSQYETFIKLNREFRDELFNESIKLLFINFNLERFVGSSAFDKLLLKIYSTDAKLRKIIKTCDPTFYNSTSLIYFKYLTSDFFNINKTIETINSQCTKYKTMIILKIDFWMLFGMLSQKYIDFNIIPTYTILASDIFKLLDSVYSNTNAFDYKYKFNSNKKTQIMFFINNNKNAVSYYFSKSSEKNVAIEKFINHLLSNQQYINLCFAQLYHAFELAYNNFAVFECRETNNEKYQNYKKIFSSEESDQKIKRELEKKLKSSELENMKERIFGNESILEKMNNINLNEMAISTQFINKNKPTMYESYDRNCYGTKIYRLVAEKIRKNLLQSHGKHQETICLKSPIKTKKTVRYNAGY